MFRLNLTGGCSILILALILLGGCALMPSNQSSQQEQKAVTQANEEGAKGIAKEVNLSFSTPDLQPTLGEPVVLNFTVENDLNVPVKIDLGQDRKEAFLLTITQPGGTKAQLPQRRQEGISLLGELALEPKQTYTQKLLLNEWYEFTTPGKHEVEVRLANPVQGPGGEKVSEDEPYRIAIEIQARDAERLEQAASERLRSIMEAKSYDDAAEASLELSYIKDPVAVQYLEKALVADYRVKPIIINGLQRIGDTEAVRVLMSTLRSPDNETAQLARHALSVIEQKSSDEALKQRIKRALLDNHL